MFRLHSYTLFHNIWMFKQKRAKLKGTVDGLYVNLKRCINQSHSYWFYKAINLYDDICGCA